MSRAPLLPWLALALALPAAAQQRTYLRLAEERADEGAGLLRDLEAQEKGGDHERAARTLDRLLELSMDPDLASCLVEVGPNRWEGLRAAALRRAAKLPPAALTALGKVQDPLATSLRNAPAELLVRRYPWSRDGATAAFELIGRAIETGAAGRARALRRGLLEAHPELAGGARMATHEALLAIAAGDAARVGSAIAALEAAPAGAGKAELIERLRAAQVALAPPRAPRLAPAPPPGATLVQKATALLTDRPEEAPPGFAPAIPVEAGGRILVSTGSMLLVLSAEGKPVARVPALSEWPATPPPERTRFAARVWTSGELAATPLVLERWPVPARAEGGPPGASDASFAGSFYSLLLVDPASGRLLWWDGDQGPGAPPGEGQAARPPPGYVGPDAAHAPGRGLLERLRQGHVIAVTGDADRIYAALLFQGDELELGVFAWERDAAPQALPAPAASGPAAPPPLVLRPAWSAVTHLFTAERQSEGGGADTAVHPEVAAALALDAEGRLVITTDVGPAACVDAHSGDLVWLHDAPPQRATPAGGPRRGGFMPAPPPTPQPPQPAVALPGDLLGFVQGAQVVAVDPGGTPAWSVTTGEPPRFLVQGERVVAYAGNRVVLLAGRTGQVLFESTLGGDRIAGEAVPSGDGVLIPVVLNGIQPFVRRVEIRQGGAGGYLVVGKTWAVPHHKGPVNLALVGDQLVAASSRRVSLLAWEPGGR